MEPQTLVHGRARGPVVVVVDVVVGAAAGLRPTPAATSALAVGVGARTIVRSVSAKSMSADTFMTRSYASSMGTVSFTHSLGG
jgi:hypothetical protein